MKMPDHTGAVRKWAGLLLLFGGSWAAAQPSLPSGEAILKRMEDGLASLKDYSVTLDITADIERLNVPPMNARMFFKKPDRIHFDAQGFALLPREGLALNVGSLMTKYSVVRVDREQIDSIAMYRVTLQASSDRARLRTLLLYVHPERWTAEKLVTPQIGDRFMSIRFRYGRIDGFWLPEEMVATFSFAAPDTSDRNPFDQVMPTRQRQQPRNGTVSVRYSAYRVNTGLSDDIFREHPADAGVR